MTRLVLPALRGDDTLGFLAALGLLELCDSGLHVPVRLGWEGPGGAAMLEAPYDDVDALASAVGQFATALSAEGRLIPGTDVSLIRPPLGTHARRAMEDPGSLDPMRLPISPAIARFQAMQDAETSDAARVDARWLTALVNQVAPAKRDASDRRLTPLYSPSGQMTLHQLYRDALEAVESRPGLLHEALSGWRRYPGAGANLDSRALVDAAEASRGKSANREVPGATWLALQSVPWFTQVGDGIRGETAGWLYPRGGALLRWPIWRPLLDPEAVRVLLSHPMVTADVLAPETAVLGVCAVAQAGRRALSKSAGPLQSPTVRLAR